MRNYFLALLAILTFSSTAIGQLLDPTEWATSVKKLSDTEYELITTVTIDEGWHLYSQIPGEDTAQAGPIPTEFSFFGSDDNFELVGANEELSERHKEFSKLFDMTVRSFDSQAIFKQKIKLLNPDLEYIAGEGYFMVCDDERCLPPAPESLLFKFKDDVDVDVTSIINEYYDSGATPIIATYPEETAETVQKDTEKNDHDADVVSGDKDSTDDSRGIWTIFFLSFLGGFAALLTPCVFPMIPLTVSFFTKQSKTRSAGIRNAILYGVFIIVIYVLLGSIITGIFGADALNALSTDVWFNVLFFLLLVVFAASFLGAFEIALPQSWANKVDSKADKGGIVGIFFMALALAIVSFSCTGPIVGTLLVESASKGGFAPIIGMLGFSSALALPFALFAVFPGWMNTMPKSGGWLNTVKVFLGFLELALAFKFLSNADLVLQLHWLEREVFLAIWIAVFGTLALYMFGKIRLPHDGAPGPISVGRLMMGLLVLTFTMYLVPGLWGAPLKLISGFPPALNYSESPYGVGYTKTGGGLSEAQEIPDGAHLAVYDIIAFHDYETGVAYAKEVNKPILIDFTGWACVNCRKMEERVWGEPSVLNQLKNDVVLISLYVDEKKSLPKEEQYVSETTGNRIKTVGNKWSDFQIERYQVNAQPYYAITDTDGKDLIKPIGYTPDIKEYEDWLEEGIANFKN